MSVIMFFFSSRRRHTRFDCDWSSDVCSSDLYLSQEHRDAAEHGCPMPALGAEIARLSPTSREIFEQHLSRLVAALGSKLDPRSPDATPAIPAVALCVGGLLLARAVKDRAVANRLLDECRAAALQQIETTAGLGGTS